MADGKSIFPFLSSSAEGRSEYQESRIKEFQTGGKMSKTDPRKPIWFKDIPNQKQGSKGNQIFRKITESRKTLIKEKNESPTPVVSELRRNQASVRLTKSCHFDRIKKCTNLEWLEFWNSRMADSNSIPQPAGSNKTPNSKVPSELTRDQIKRLILRNLQNVLEKNGMNFSRV